MASIEANNQSTHTFPEPVNNQSTHTNSNTLNHSTSVIPNPYFLNSSENPGNILVTQPLLGMRNYQSWSRAMVLALTAKKKIGFVNGKVTKRRLGELQYHGAFVDDQFHACGCFKQHNVLRNSEGDVD